MLKKLRPPSIKYLKTIINLLHNSNVASDYSWYLEEKKDNSELETMDESNIGTILSPHYRRVSE